METGRLDLVVEVLSAPARPSFSNQGQVTINNMSRISRIVVLVTSVAALVGAMAGTAGAVTWHVSGSGSFTATAPSVTLSMTSNLTCASTTATGTYVPGSFVGPLYSGVTGTFTLSGCNLAGQGFEISCGYRLTGTAQPAATVVTGSVDVTCGVTNGVTKLCHIAGSQHAIYTKRVAPAMDTLTFTTSTLNISGSGCIFGNNDTMHLAEQTFTVTSAGGGPHIVRTA